jgi:hypothetical protein
MDQNLCRRLLPHPILGRSRPPTAAAAPATFRMVHLQVVGREQMTIAADTGYGHGLEDTFQGKAHDISFGCSKARPRYHLQKNSIEFNWLHHELLWRPATHRRISLTKAETPRDIDCYVCFR